MQVGSSAMCNLLASAAAFVLLHRAISGSPVRGLIVGLIGELAYGQLFQIASIAGLVWLAVAYAGASQPAVVGQLWSASPLVRNLQLIIQPLALLLIVTGFATLNPGTFRQEAVADQPDIVHGILRVTRHPFLWGVVLLAAGHLLSTPSPRNLVLFGTLLTVALTGTISIDAKRRCSIGPKWTAFASRTLEHTVRSHPRRAATASPRRARLDKHHRRCRRIGDVGPYSLLAFQCSSRGMNRSPLRGVRS
jgi:uncharacterized membrane protein